MNTLHGFSLDRQKVSVPESGYSIQLNSKLWDHRGTNNIDNPTYTRTHIYITVTMIVAIMKVGITAKI